MPGPYQHIAVERVGDVACVRLQQQQLEESEVQRMGDELLALVHDEGCRNVVLILGPEPPYLIYSVFMGKLLALRRTLLDLGGGLKLCDVSPHVRGVFEALQLTDYFEFYPDQAAAVAAFAG
jgi:hypothetical protein